MEIVMGCLLCAAFLAMNVLSLSYMLFIAIGMSAPLSVRGRLWCWMVMPLLGLLVLFQYSLMVGLPAAQPTPDEGISEIGWVGNDEQTAMYDWLGIGTVDTGAVWALFLSFAASVVQVGTSNLTADALSVSLFNELLDAYGRFWHRCWHAATRQLVLFWRYIGNMQARPCCTRDFHNTNVAPSKISMFQAFRL